MKVLVKTVVLYALIGVATQAGNWVWYNCLENKANQVVNNYRKRKKIKCKTIKYREI